MRLVYIFFKEKSQVEPELTKHTKLLSDHYRLLSRVFAIRVDEGLNVFVPKMFYEVVPILTKGTFGVEVKVYDENVGVIVEKYFSSLKNIHDDKTFWDSFI